MALLLEDSGSERLGRVVVTLHDAFAACPRSFRSPPDPFVTCPPATGFVPCVRCLAPDAGGLPEEALIAGLRARHASFAGELAAAAAVLAPSHFQAARMEAVLGLAPGSRTGSSSQAVEGHGVRLGLGNPQRGVSLY